MSEHIFRAIVPAIIVLLIVWLIYRLKRQIKLIIKNEIYDDFPAIRDEIGNFESKINYLKMQIDILERRIKELQGRS